MELSTKLYWERASLGKYAEQYKQHTRQGLILYVHGSIISGTYFKACVAGRRSKRRRASPIVENGKKLGP